MEGYIKIHNTSFRKDTGKVMSLKFFKETYSKLLPKDADLESIYKQLGGKVQKKKIEDTEK